MLHEIYCEKFSQKHIVFNPGLSVVLGTLSGDNSIGKSTFLLVVDHVLGGETYSKTYDIIHNIGEHEIFFSFIFDGITHYFCRKVIDNSKVYQCNDQWKIQSEMGLQEYLDWLSKKYQITLPSLTFRNSVGRYTRVYAKENCNEKHPLHQFPAEKGDNACMALLMLFDEYTTIESVRQQAKKSEEEYSSFTKAQKHQFIPTITKSKRKENDDELVQLRDELNAIGNGLEQKLLDSDATLSEEAVIIKKELSRARRMRTGIAGNLGAIQENGEYAFSSTTKTFTELQSFFPNINLAKITEVESFHKKIAAIFKAELQEKAAELSAELSEYDQIISSLEADLAQLIDNPNIPKTVLNRHAEIVQSIKQKEQENELFDKQEALKKTKSDDADRLATIRMECLQRVANAINSEMNQLNQKICNGLNSAPMLSFTQSSYKFDVYGTGDAFKGLISFDLAVLKLSKLPLLVHDSLMLKQISDDAVEQIMRLYGSAGKQVIIAMDKPESYTAYTEKVLNEAAVLKLAPNGQELFGRKWN